MTNASVSVAVSPASSPLWSLLGPPLTPLSRPGVEKDDMDSVGLANTTHSTSTLGEGREAGGGGVSEGGESCLEWRDTQHTLFQLANLCVALAFLTPITFRFHLLFLRSMLLLAFSLFLLWAALFVCLPDVLAWNLAFLLLNGGHLLWLAYRHLPSSMPASQAGLYSKVFRPVKLSEAEFREFCDKGSLHEVSQGALYAIEGATPCGYLAVLVKGRLKVTYRRLFLHYVETNQFVDATEYDSQPLQQDHSDTYQVSISAAEDSVLLRWDYPTLQEYLSTRPFISTMLHYLTGKDVCSHLYAIQEHLMQTPDYMVTLTSRHSSMVNVRSCLAAQDSSASLSRIANLPDHHLPKEQPTFTIGISPSPTEETCL